MIARALLRIADRRPPDRTIGGTKNPYMRRWFVVPKNPWINVYLHHFLRSDDDRALHDHPWWNISFLLRGRYVEHTIRDGGISVRTERSAGQFKLRSAKSAHRIELVDGPCWTLFITGPKIRTWGFHCPNGWRDWRDFTAFRKTGNGHEIGPGCGEGE